MMKLNTPYPINPAGLYSCEEEEPLYEILKELCENMAYYELPYDPTFRADRDVLILTILDHYKEGRISKKEKDKLIKIMLPKATA